MMPGVEILSQTDITTIPKWILVLVGIFTFIFAVCFILQIGKNGFVEALVPVLTPLILIAVFLILGMTVLAEPTGRYKYTAYVDETVNMVEFFEQYDNVTFDSETFAFEDKEEVLK